MQTLISGNFNFRFCYSGIAIMMVAMFADAMETLELGKEPTQEIGDIKSLDIYGNSGTIHMLIADSHEIADRSYLRYLRSIDAGHSWSSAVRVDEGASPPYARGRGTDFHLAAAGDRIVAVWMTKGSGFMGRGPLVSAYSEDGGETWHPGANPADDGTDGDHSFIDMVADSHGNFHVIWLDKRDGNAKGLFASKSSDGGKTWSKNVVIDSATCDCCWNVLTTDSRGRLYAFYRDLEPRDMALAVSDDGGDNWASAGFVGKFGWDFNGCPHVGGGFAVTDNSNGTLLHSVVWTGKEKFRGLYYLQSAQKEIAWTAPKRMGTEFAKYSDIAASIEGDLIVVWEDYVNDEAAIFSSISTDNGKTWSETKIQSATGVHATHPRVTSLKNKFHVFWTEKNNGKAIWKNRML